jgi:hypothetical protein
MRWQPRAYPVTIRQELTIEHLAKLSAIEADEAEESGYLAGNQMYQDLRGLDWVDVARSLEVERQFIARLQAAADVDAEAARIDDERLDCLEPVDALWELDIGVASAAIALSALGAIPVGSCNAGGFGGRHQAAYPYVAFFLDAAAPDSIISIAQAASVGLHDGGNGLAQIFGADDLDLLRFAEAALDHRGPALGPKSAPPLE